MSISLTWIKYGGTTPPHNQTVVLENGGTIGRADDNNFVLFDPEHYCSRYHARILQQGGSYYIEDTSAPGTRVNGTIELARGQKYELMSSDTIELGDCELRVDYAEAWSENSGDHTSSKTISKEITQVPHVASSAGHQPTGGSDSFNIDDFFGEPAPAAQEFQPEVAPSSLANLTVDEIFNSGSNIQQTNHSNSAANIDDIFSSTLSTRQENLREDFAAEQDSPQTREVIGRPSQAPGNDTLALRAFLSELDLDPSQFVGQNKAEIMRVAGIILRTLTEGMMGVLAARDAVKEQFAMDRTQIQSAKNNPLKFSMSPQEAMSKMLTQEDGYMDPIESAKEAVDDAKAHQIAMVSGISATIRNTVACFDPEKLEKDFDVGFAFGGKRAKYWELYIEKYSKLAKDVESGSNDMFSEQFREHYEKQLNKLR